MYRELDAPLTAEQEALKEAAHRFAAEVLRPTATALDRLADPSTVVAAGSPLWGVFREAWRVGYHKAVLPREVGGLGLRA